METIWKRLLDSPESLAILIAAVLATLGWFLGGRLQRSLLKKQHTFNALLNASFNDRFQRAQTAVRPYTRENEKLPNLNEDGNGDLKLYLVFLLNHYEFLSAGIRNGDISERLLRDSERGTIVRLYEASEEFIASTRNSRRRKTTFEHIEWLYERWDQKPPSEIRLFFERIWGKPFS